MLESLEAQVSEKENMMRVQKEEMDQALVQID